MIAACDKSGVQLMYAEELCFAPKYVRLKQLLDGGALGDPVLIKQSEKHDGPHAEHFWDVERSGGGVAMDMGWVVTVASPTNPSAQVTIIGNDDMAAPGISVEVPDVDAVHARAVERGLEIAYSLRDEEWGVRRFMVREPSGTLINVVSHRSG